MKPLALVLVVAGCASETVVRPDETIPLTHYACEGGRDISIGYDRWGPGTVEYLSGDIGYVLERARAPAGVMRFEDKGDDLGYSVWEVKGGVGALRFHEAGSGREVVQLANCQVDGG